jgi:hypothetical protein
MRFGGSGACGAFGAGVALAAVAALVGTSLVARDARAVGTRTFELDSLDKLSGGDLKGASVTSDGVVRAGWMLGNAPLPSGLTTATAAVALPDGSVVVATGTGRKAVRFTGDQPSVFAETKEDILALAVSPQGGVFAGTDSGKIYRLSQGKADVFATVPDVSSIDALAFDKSGALFAGTGSEGQVVRVDANGGSSVYFKTDDPFVVSVAVGEDGAVYAGTSGKGLLYKITAVGRATVLYDFPADEVRAVAAGPKGTIYAIANEGGGSANEPSESAASRRGSGGGRGLAGPTTTPRPKVGKGSLWRFDAQGRPERLMHHDEFHYMSLAVGADGAPLVGTGAEGRVYTVDDAHVVSLVADTDERQVMAVGAAGRERWIVGSDPAVFHRVLGVGGAQAMWTSKALDAGLRARFGHITWRGTGSLEVSTRSGNTQSPDASWSAWSSTVQQGGVASSPAARFVQVRAGLGDANATIADVTLAFVTENLRAVVTEVAAKPKASGTEAKEGIAQSGNAAPKHDSVVHLSWKVDNPDSDELRYRVQFRQEGQQRWVDATRADDVLTKSELDWDTTALPEGKYRVRIDASDEMSNPPDDTQRHTLESPPVLVDNTPPVFKSVAVQGRRLKAQVSDGVGPIVRVEVAMDGRVEWRPVGAADGIFDTADEAVDADLTTLLPVGPGPHLVTVRAYDAAGNSAVREVEAP